MVGYPRIVGNNHLKFAVRDRGQALSAIGFGFGERIIDLRVGHSRIDVVFSIAEDSFFGKKKTTLKIKDMKETEPDVAK